MPTYEFTLTFSVARGCPSFEDCVDLLGEHGCDDAILGIGKPGRIGMTFDRSGRSADEAVSSALRDVRRALPHALLLEAAPDFVGVTEIAEIVGRSRQNIRQLMLACGSAAPPPLHEGTSSLWHLSDVLVWLRDSKGYFVDAEVLSLAATAKQVNLLVARREVDRDIERRLAALV